VGVVTGDPFADRLAATLHEAQGAVPLAAPEYLGAVKARYARTRRRRALVTASACVVLLLLAGASVALSRGPRSTADSAASAARRAIDLWTLAFPIQNRGLREAIAEFNRHSPVKVKLTTFDNDDYKYRLTAAMASAEPPDIFFNWGGGNLTQYVQAGNVADLTEVLRARPDVAGAFVPTVLAGGAVGGRQFGLPMNGMQPIVLFYNKDVFARAGLQPPRTYPELLTLVDAFRARGVTPLALAGATGWAQLMYAMYFLDRLDGPRRFRDIAAGASAGWTDPAVVQAARYCVELVERGAFDRGFSDVDYDNGAASALLASGRAAMHVMGAWEYPNLLATHGEFVRRGALGWVPFPALLGGRGDPDDVMGVPANYFSVRADSPYRDLAIDFLLHTLTSAGYVDGLVATGAVPAIHGIEAKLAGTPHAEFTTFTYQTVARAKSFTLAWDQMLTPSMGAVVNVNLQRLFRAEITPEEFAVAMASAA
jgi:xylobiose transport system substrate-binding protein